MRLWRRADRDIACDASAAPEAPALTPMPIGAPMDFGTGHKARSRVVLVLHLAASLAIAAALAFMSALVYYTVRFPDPMALSKSEGGALVRVLARDGTVMLERGQSHSFVPLDFLPRHVIDAVVATEDRRFFQHNGIDPFGLLRAAFANLRAGRYVQGGSTLSQQLAKNLFLSPERTIGRKLEECLLAIWLEVRLSKADILELYLNRVYFGGGAYGIEGAAQRYFGKSARQLGLAEAAVLAGLLKAPSKYSPLSSPGIARLRGRVVLKKMLAAGLIAPEAEAAAARQSVQFADLGHGREPTGLEYAVEFALDRLPPLIGAGHREIIVETTFDLELQKRTQRAITEALERAGTAAGAGQAAAVVIASDGGIRAIVGGRSFAHSQFNRAARARRQPGSAFKPLVYLAAVEQGSTPDTPAIDMPVNIGGWSPRNENGKYVGQVSLRQALAQSINTVAVRLQQDVGTRQVIALTRRLGIRSELRPDPSLALGTSEVTLLELSGAYATLASGGYGVEPHVILAVRSTGNSVLYRRSQAPPRRVISPVHVGMMSSMLHSAMVSGTGRRAALARHAAAGKTGTSQDYRDAWFIGYTPHLTAGVWVGNDGGEPMNRVMGGGLPATIWREIMEAAHERLPAAVLPGANAMDLIAASDILVDADRRTKPILSITDLLARDGQAVPAPLPSHANGATHTRDAVTRAGLEQGKRASQRPSRRASASTAPSHSVLSDPARAPGPIDAQLFERALEDEADALRANRMGPPLR